MKAVRLGCLKSRCRPDVCSYAPLQHDPDADNEDLSLSAMLQPRVQKIRIRNSHIDNAMRAGYDHEASQLPGEDLWRQRMPLDLDGLGDVDGGQDPARPKKRKRRKSQHGKAKGGIRKVRRSRTQGMSDALVLVRL